jgi:D-alanine-D-alanine ligase
LKAAVVYSRLPAGELAPDDDRFEEFDAPDVPAAVAAALGRLGHVARAIEDDEELVGRLRRERPDFVVNLAEGRRGRGREAILPSICEHLEIPYTGSDSLTLAASLDKDVAKRLVSPFVEVAPGWLVRAGEELPEVTLPAIVKPVCEGSSKGIRDGASVVSDRGALAEQVRRTTSRYGQPALVEAFVEGAEVTAAVLGGKPPKASEGGPPQGKPPMAARSEPKASEGGPPQGEQPRVAALMQAIPRSGDQHRFVYTLEAKRDWRNRVRYAVPPELPAAVIASLERAALSVFSALGCRDVARIDFRVTRDGRPVFLEANPLPGLSPEKGDIVIATRAAGMSYDALIGAIVERAVREAARTRASRESAGAIALPRAWSTSHPISEV